MYHYNLSNVESSQSTVAVRGCIVVSMSSSIPTTSKVLKGDGGTSITLENRQTPSPTGTQVLLKIEASGVCATDLHLVRKALPHLKPKVDIQGHEGIGRIMKVGPDVDGSKWKVGDLVAHRWLWSVCQQCELCQGGNEQLCDERKLSGMHVDGCWAGEIEIPGIDSTADTKIPDRILFIRHKIHASCIRTA